MTDKELVKALRDFADDGYADLSVAAADRIEALTAKVKLMDDLDVINGEKIEALTEQLEAARADAKEAEAYAEELEAKLAEAVEALRKLHHAVCGETGFAACVRLDSGLAYPWPALDEADEMTRTTLAEIEGEKT